ncbi:hypothetical protein SO802_007804 [Lithocarpus litseifolius]|uniref:Uncharacterized protein n=1 Tax=Lithocarpus litseifolius TaxID=425828 RepID=A0AAW2DVD5_9ROSI
MVVTLYVFRDFELWIESEGTLTPEQNKFGPNLRAPPFVALRKNVITIPSFYAAKKKMNAENTVDRNSSQHSGLGRENVPKQPQKETASSEAKNNSPSMRKTYGGVNWAEMVIQNQTDTVIIEELKSLNEFETALKDIDEEIGLAEEFGSAKKSFKNPDAHDNLSENTQLHMSRAPQAARVYNPKGKKKCVLQTWTQRNRTQTSDSTTETLQTPGKKRLAVGDEVHIELLAKLF